MAVIPPGEFSMGSPDGEGYASEQLRHKVKMERPFAVGTSRSPGMTGRPALQCGDVTGGQPQMAALEWGTNR